MFTHFNQAVEPMGMPPVGARGLPSYFLKLARIALNLLVYRMVLVVKRVCYPRCMAVAATAAHDANG